MNLTVKVDEVTARQEVDTFLDGRKMMPRFRKSIEAAIETIVEAIVYGIVAINDDGSITQNLVTPVDSRESLTYKPHVTAFDMNAALIKAKAQSQIERNVVYITTYTGCLTSTVNKLEPTDRSNADSIAFFLQ
jgi:hypothetical protein